MSRLFIEMKNTSKKNTFYLDRMKKINVHFTLNSNEISTQVFPLYGIKFVDKHGVFNLLI